MALGNQFMRVLITQLTEVERATPGDVEGFIEQGAGIEPGQILAAAQVALTVRVQALPGLGHRDVVTNGGHGVLQGPTATHVHVHVARGDSGEPEAPGQGQQVRQALAVVLPAVQLHR